MRLILFLACLVLPVVAEAALPAHIAQSIEDAARERAQTNARDAALERSLTHRDFHQFNRFAAERRAGSRFSAIVIGAIAENPALAADVVAAAVAAAPDLRDVIVGDASAAYPGFANIIAAAAGAAPRAPAPPPFAPTTRPPPRDLSVEDDDIAEDDLDEDNDPLETINRGIFEVNEVFIRFVLRPVAQGYRFIFPDAVRESIGNLLANLNAPRILVNDLLQWEPRRAWNTTARFAINSTVGVAGLFDVADKLDFEKHTEDFGQTLAVWGIGEWVYLVIPLIGPSNPRDLVGRVADGFADPLNLWANNTDRDYIVYSRLGVTAVSFYESIMDDLDEIQDTSVDYYAAIRSFYRQRRQTDILNGKGADNLDYDLDDEDL